MNKRKIGDEKEQFVCGYLERHGYRILQRNFRCRFGEIDIVARQGTYLVFIEVKYRSGKGSGTAEEAVTLKKQRIISRVALFYLARYGYAYETPVRFDVVALAADKDLLEVNVLANAFSFLE